MVKHVIIWKIKDEYSDIEKNQIKADMKKNLEALVGKVPGLLELKIITEGLKTSTGDVMLDSTLESEEALSGYAVHSDHVAAADSFVRPFMKERSCMDYEL